MLRRRWQDLWFSLQCAKDGNKKHKTKDNKSIKKKQQKHQKKHQKTKASKNKSIKKQRHQKTKASKKQEMDLLTIWASAHGLAAIACMSGVIPSMDWDEMLERDDLLR